MGHATRGLVVGSLALVLGCGANGQEPASSPQGDRQTVTEDQLLRNRFVAPDERVGTPWVTLTQQDAGCLKTEPLGPEYAKKGRQVIWLVFNDCKETALVRVDNFAIKPPPGQSAVGDFPFDPGPQECTAPAGGRCTIRLTVRQDPPKGTPTGRPVVFVYTYDFLVNGTPTDPEIIIEWF